MDAIVSTCVLIARNMMRRSLEVAAFGKSSQGLAASRIRVLSPVKYSNVIACYLVGCCWGHEARGKTGTNYPGKIQLGRS